MRETSEEGSLQIQYATARIEAVMVKMEAAIKLLLEDYMKALERRMKLLDETVLKHHPDRSARPLGRGSANIADWV